jgi:hypothetical protein
MLVPLLWFRVKSVFIKVIYSTFLLLTGLILNSWLIGCDSTNEPDTLFKAEERITGEFDYYRTVKKIVITNPIGLTYLFGDIDTIKTRYVTDKSVWAKSYQAAETELRNINFVNAIVGDTAMYDVTYPANTQNIYGCTLNLNVNTSNVELTSPNKGLQTDFLNATLKTETDAYPVKIYHHSGSVNVKTVSGDISSSIAIPVEGYCICYSETGDINIKIPQGTSASFVLKTNTGRLTIRNLNPSFITNTPTEVSGILNNGSGTFYLESKTGNVTLEGL